MTLSLIGGVLFGCLALIQAQPLRRRDRDMDIGIFNGHLIGIDDANLPAYSDLRGFLGVNTLPVVPPLSTFLTGTPTVGLGVAGPITTRRLRRCQKDACPTLRIKRECKYTPVLQDLSGQYCRGCDQDICLSISPRRGQGLSSLTGVGARGGVRGRARGDRGDRAENKEERKRLRKIRRRVCRTTGNCPGNTRQEIMQGQLRRSMLGRSSGGRNGARGLLVGQNQMSVLAGVPQVGVMAGVPRVPGVVGGMPVRGLTGGLPVGGLTGGLPIGGLTGGLPVGGLTGGLPVGGLTGGLPVGGLPQVGLVGGRSPVLGGVSPVRVIGGPQVGIIPPAGMGGRGPMIGGLLGNILGNAGMQNLAG